MYGIMARTGRPVRVHPRRSWLVAGAAVAGLAAAAVFAVLPSSSPVGGPVPANALSITEDAGYLVITIKDPAAAADAARYEAEIKRHGLDIKITLVPARPESVGEVVMDEVGEGGELSYIEAPGRCTSHGSCTVGVTCARRSGKTCERSVHHPGSEGAGGRSRRYSRPRSGCCSRSQCPAGPRRRLRPATGVADG